MTTSTNRKPNNKTEDVVSETPATEGIVTADVIEQADSDIEQAISVQRIPEYLANNSILGNFCEQYLSALDAISAYNKEVLAAKSDTWNSHKVFEKAREMARPTDNKIKPVADVKSALENFERLLDEMNKARKAVVDVTSKELGITLSVTAERNPEIEAPLKEKRKLAATIGTTMSQIAGMTTDKEATDAVTEFLANNPLPAIGRDQVSTFGDNATPATPKYRVNVKVTKDGEQLMDEDSFTKAALKLSQPAFGYDRGQSLKSDKLREVWEKAGNSPTNSVSPVVFQDNGLEFTLTKR